VQARETAEIHAPDELEQRTLMTGGPEPAASQLDPFSEGNRLQLTGPS
jgi:hypothetical protein